MSAAHLLIAAAGGLPEVGLPGAEQGANPKASPQHTQPTYNNTTPSPLPLPQPETSLYWSDTPREAHQPQASTPETSSAYLSETPIQSQLQAGPPSAYAEELERMLGRQSTSRQSGARQQHHASSESEDEKITEGGLRLEDLLSTAGKTIPPLLNVPTFSLKVKRGILFKRQRCST